MRKFSFKSGTFFMFDPCKDEMLTFDFKANNSRLIHRSFDKLKIS